MKYIRNGIEQSENYYLMMLYSAGATIEDIRNMLEGYSFTGEDGDIYEIEEVE